MFKPLATTVKANQGSAPRFGRHTSFVILSWALGISWALGASQALASQPTTLSVEIPRLQVAEYHRPYVAIWLSDTRQQRVADVAVWYDVAMARDEGLKWLPDMRQWWRRSGRSLQMPVDGVSGATRPVGTHQVAIPDDLIASLAAGDYILHIEAAREVGGREHLQLPFAIDSQGRLQSDQLSIQGQHELGLITFNL